ncbi:MAG: hypothetical protein M3P29_04120 [Acidobacteriota bacterium]|nr:hypothetical protein [Acidobacteriota bacterium]
MKTLRLGTAVILLLGAATVFAQNITFGPEDRLIGLAPHPADEILGCAGMMTQTHTPPEDLTQIRKGGRVRSVAVAHRRNQDRRDVVVLTLLQRRSGTT